MENSKYIKILIPIFILGFFIFQNNIVLAYSVDTHAYLTGEIIKFYNQKFSNNKIPKELKDFLVDGSRREDDVPRWMNHFYDPVYNRGLTNSILGVWQKSKNWAQDSNNQNSLTYKAPATIASILTAIQQRAINAITTETDFTWQRAIRFYVNDDKEKAMFMLGHILHLIEDKAVPDHTRNDAHPAGSPYESYAGQFSLFTPDNKLSQRINGKEPIIFDGLNSYFDDLAKYSNNNFYSADTIGIQSSYKIPEPEFYPKKVNGLYFAFKKSPELGKDYLLFLIKKYKDGDSLLSLPIENISLKDPQSLVLQDYWNLLSTKSTQYGAGVINLFFQEVEKAKNDPNFAKEEKSFFAQVIDAAKDFLFGDNQGFQEVRQVAINQTGEVQPIEPQNIKQCSFATSQKPSHSKIIINEVAWMGGISNATDEWVELKNISSGAVDLTSWQLIDKAEQIKINLSTSDVNILKIPAGGFLLLERNSDEAVPSVKADLIYTGALSNTDEGLRLFDANCNLVDEVLADSKWPAGDNTSKKTMERNSSDLNWHTSNIVGGTPKRENSQPLPTQPELIPEETPTSTLLLTSTSTSVSTSTPLIINNTGITCSFTTSQSPSRQKVIINEVAWMGTASSTDEWIELKNISGAELNLNGYQLIDQGEQIKINLLTSDVNILKIPAGGFYLLERTDDNTIPNITADKIYTGGLSKTNEGLRLFDSQCNLIDEVLANPDWRAGDNSSKQTMERKNDLNWQTSASPGGTPKAANSSGYVIYGGGSGGGGSSSNTQNTNNQEQAQYSKILINEIQTYPTGERFIELYNPNSSAVDLTNWYIQRKTQSGTSFDSLVTKSNFENKTIGAYGYFLISRISLDDADIILDNLTLTESNTIQIKNPNGEIVDKVGWGSATDCEGNCAVNPADSQSIQRKFQNDTFVDTDNNSQDFEIQTCPSPKVQSQACQPASDQTPNYILISEIYPDKTGNNFDFVELYNSTNAEISLADYSLKIQKESATSTSSLASFSNNNSIAAKSFFLVGLDKYSSSTNPTADISRSYSLLTSTSTIIFLIEKDAVIDQIIYNPLNLTSSQSLERKANSSSTIDSMTSGEDRFLGNGYDSDSAEDFILRETPEPQNSQSFPEPRIAPTAPENFTVQYSSSTMKLIFNWEPSQDYSGTTSTITYKITNISTSDVDTIETASTTAEISINEVGRSYNFSIIATDKEGYESPKNEATISVSQSSLMIAQQTDKSFFETGTGNGQFYQLLGNGLMAEPKEVTFHAKFISGSSNPAYYFNVSFWESDSSDYSNLVQVSSNTCYRYGDYGLPDVADGNCPNFNFEYEVEKDYTIPIQEPFVFNPAKYYKMTIFTYQNWTTFYGSSDENSYLYGKSTRYGYTNTEGIGTGVDSSLIKDIYFIIPSKASFKTPPQTSQLVPQIFSPSYSSSTLEIIFNWGKPRYFENTTSTLTYKIIDISNSSSTLPNIETTATSSRVSINEVGRNYKFSIQAFDEMGTGSIIDEREIKIPYSLVEPFVVASQLDNSVSEQGTGNGQFYQTLGSGLSGKLGAITFKVDFNPAPHYISVDIYQSDNPDYSSLELISGVAQCYFHQEYQQYGGVNCSQFMESNIITFPTSKDFTFDPAKYYKLYFITYQSSSYFYGSVNESAYLNGQASKINNDVGEISTSAVKDMYFVLTSRTPL